MSVPPPGDVGTMMRTAFEGHGATPCPNAGCAAASRHNADRASTVARRMHCAVAANSEEEVALQFEVKIGTGGVGEEEWEGCEFEGRASGRRNERRMAPANCGCTFIGS